MDISIENVTAQKVDLFLGETAGSPWTLQSLGAVTKNISELSLSDASTIATIAKTSANSPACIIVLSVSEKDYMQLIYPFVLSLSSRIKNKSACVIILTKKSNPKFEELFLRAGCSEVLEYSISAKTFSYKLKRQFAIMTKVTAVDAALPQNAIRKSGPKAKENETIVKGGAFLKQESPNARILQTETSGSEQSFWLFRHKKYARKYHEHWLIEIIGPGPSAGKWLKQSTEPKDTEKWKWEPRQEGSVFDPNPAAWIFTGARPYFDRTVNRWGFISPNPRLELVSGGKVMEILFYKKSELVLQVNDSSQRALDRLPSIQETFDPERRWIEGDVAPSIPWCDQLNTKNLSRSNWGIAQSENSRTAPTVARSEDTGVAEIMMGQAAMANCSLKAKIGNLPVAIISYTPGAMLLVLDLGSPVEDEGQNIEVQLQLENMGENPKANKTVKLVGTRVSGIAREHSHELTLELNEDGNYAFLEIENAVARRQREIFYFFNRARGV